MRKRTLFYMSACLAAACPSLLAHDPHDPIDVVAVSPNYAQDHTVVVATDDFTLKQGVYAILKSTDGGVTWSALPGLPANANMVAIVFSPNYSSDQTLFVAGVGGLFGTTDQGATWSSLRSDSLTSVALSPNFATDNTMFVVTSKKTIFKSTDRGQTWKSVKAPTGLTASLTVIALSPNYGTDHTLLLGSTKNGIYKSTNRGASWTSVTSGLKMALTAFTFSPAFSTDQTVYAGAYGGGVLISTNGGTAWTASNSGITDLNVAYVALSPNYTQDSTLWIATSKGGIFQSNTKGASWAADAKISRQLSPQRPTHYRAVVPAATGSGTILFLGMWEGLWTSTNSALSWQYIDTLPTRLVRFINISPNYPNDHTVFANTYGGGNLWTTDGGSTWSFRNTGMHSAYTDGSSFSPNYGVDKTAFSGAVLGLQITTDGGNTWSLSQGGLNQATYVRGLAISPNYAKDSTLLIGTRNGPASQTGNSCHADPVTHPIPSAKAKYTGLFLSTDGGTLWTKTGLTRLASAGCWGIISIAASPSFATDKTVFAASPDSGLYKSTDGGVTWTHLSPAKGMAIVTVSPNYANDQTVFAAGIFEQIIQSTDGGTTWRTVPGTSKLKAMDLQISPNYASDGSFFAATVQLGLLHFTNNGSSMAQVTSYPDTFVSAVGYSPNYVNDQTLFVASYHGVYKSTDAGQTWAYTMEPSRTEEYRDVMASGQQPPSITYVGHWSTTTPSAVASTEAFMTTPNSGDTATLNFIGTGVSWVSATGPSQGSASIELDGIPQGSVSLTSATNQYQQTVWQQQGLLCGLHSLTLTATPQAGQSVTLDAFDVSVDGCAFVNAPTAK